MIVREFPDFSRPENRPEAPCSVLGFPNALIMLDEKELHYPEHAGPLSIMCNFGNRGEYLVGRQRYVVDDTSYLILNDGQRFSTTVRSDLPVETFHVWFHRDFASRVLRDLITPSDILLEAPDGDNPQPVTFFERTYPHDLILTPIIDQIRSVLRNNQESEEWEEEQYHTLLECLLRVHRVVFSEIEAIPGVRRSTRIEIYRRLHDARDHIDANIEKRLTLEKISRVAFMSSHHFLRLFRGVFGITPHQYLTQKRLQRACKLLEETSLTVAEICKRVGFTSHGSFSWMFRRKLHSSPEEYRRAARMTHPHRSEIRHSAELLT